MSHDYRLAPHLAARLFGLALLLLGAVVLVAGILVVLLDLPTAVLTVAVVVAVVGVLACGIALRTRAYVVRTSADGYRVRFIRGAGVAQARWADVEELVTNTVAGAPCLVLRLRDGSTTTIPVQVLAVDREQFVRDIATHLQQRGFKPDKRRKR